MQEWKVRFGQVQDRAPTQPLPREVEDGEVAEFCRRRAGLCVAAPHGNGGDKVLRFDSESQIAVVRIGQLGIDYGLAAAHTCVQQRNRLLASLDRCCNANDEGSFCAVAVEAKIVEMKRSTCKYLRIDDHASLPRRLCRKLDRPLVAEVSNVR